MFKCTFPVFLIYVTCTESYLKTVNILKHSYKMMRHFQLLEYYAPHPSHSCCHLINCFKVQSFRLWQWVFCILAFQRNMPPPSYFKHWKTAQCHNHGDHNMTTQNHTNLRISGVFVSTLCFVSLFIPKNSFKYTLVIMNQITFFNNLWRTDDVCNLVWVKKSVMLQFQVKVTIFREKHGS